MGHVRTSARVILMDSEQRVLLFHAHKNVNDHAQGSLWFTPGGGVEEGEELHIAAARELFEETGITVSPAGLGPMVAYSEGFADVPGFAAGHYLDTYFFHRVGEHEIDRSGHTEWELQQLFDARWWTLTELRETREEIVPRPLAELAERFFTGHIPSEPIVIPWHH